MSWFWMAAVPGGAFMSFNDSVKLTTALTEARKHGFRFDDLDYFKGSGEGKGLQPLFSYLQLWIWQEVYF